MPITSFQSLKNFKSPPPKFLYPYSFDNIMQWIKTTLLLKDKILNFFFISYPGLFTSTYSRCGWLLLHLITVSNTHAHTHTYTHTHSVRFLWTRDRLFEEISTLQQTSFTRDRPSCPQRDWNPQSQQMSCLRPNS